MPGVNGTRLDPSAVVVLKLGSSVLTGVAGLRQAAGSVADLVRERKKVVCVVSALGRTTDELLETIRAVSGTASALDVASTLATGEDAAASLFSIALGAAGVSCTVARATSFRLLTRGPRLNARPIGANCQWLTERLRTSEVIVIPGFVGVCRRGLPTLLGRGGSDLSALFLAYHLGVRECRLVKDVDGLYTWDPNNHSLPPAQRLNRASWADAVRLGGELVQPKAVRFAEERCQTFTVTALNGCGTVVGPGPSLTERVAN